MRENARIEVHWQTKDKKHKTVVIRPGSKVKGVILNGPVDPEAVMPSGLEGDGLSEVQPGDGPLVCYLIDGQMHCW